MFCPIGEEEIARRVDLPPGGGRISRTGDGKAGSRGRISGVDGGILERDLELTRLTAAAREAADGAGSVALVFGEAGIGKSSLVNALPGALSAQARVLVGQCDDLATRRPLGPFRDLVGSVRAELAQAVTEGGDRHRVYDALRAELGDPPHPTVLVVEDVHWADEASLDALRFLVRRVDRMPAVLVLTFRDDELSREHPLRHLLGQVSRAARVHRVPLPRLSRDAVRTLSAVSGLDPAQVYAATSGNPFYVAEVVAAGGTGDVPPTVVDAVLARLRGLDDAARDALEQLAVVPSAAERTLADALLPDGVGQLTSAERRGLLVVTPERVMFRHEIIRRAIADSLPAARRIEINRNVLAVLVAQPGADASRIVHHAAEAGDQDAIARYGPDAARDAARTGAHREAAAQLRLVLRQRTRYGPAELADLLERFAVESYTIADSPAAVGAQWEAVALRRSLGDLRALGADLRWLSRIHWWAGDADAAQEAAREAIDVLEQVGDERLLALALSNTSQLRMLSDRYAEAIGYGERAITLARRTGDAAPGSRAARTRRPAATRRASPAVSSRSDGSLRRVSPTSRSPAGSSCPCARSTIMSVRSWRSSAPAPGARSPPAPRSWGWKSAVKSRYSPDVSWVMGTDIGACPAALERADRTHRANGGAHVHHARTGSTPRTGRFQGRVEGPGRRRVRRGARRLQRDGRQATRAGRPLYRRRRRVPRHRLRPRARPAARGPRRRPPRSGSRHRRRRCGRRPVTAQLGRGPRPGPHRTGRRRLRVERGGPRHARARPGHTERHHLLDRGRRTHSRRRPRSPHPQVRAEHRQRPGGRPRPGRRPQGAGERRRERGPVLGHPRGAAATSASSPPSSSGCTS